MTDELTRRAEAHLAALRRHIKIVTKLRGNGPEPAGKDRLLIESERIIAAYKQRDLCDVCLGQPLKSGRQCICGGEGTSLAEKVGLRRELHEQRAEIERLRTELEDSSARQGRTGADQ
ncbi:MAG TPA: hypothetical protein DDW98_09110 [Gammaproteobacteria bacterium]|nr:hypothetical protein [Gammaproteobacteria bacterium]